MSITPWVRLPIILLALGCGSGTGLPGDSAADAADQGQGDAPPLSDTVTVDTAGPTRILGLPLEENGILYAGASAVDITPDPGDPDPIYIAGFGRDRIAEEIRDPLWARALVLSWNREYVAVVALDLVGMTGYRSSLAAKELADMGWDAKRLLIHTTHTHAGPDTVGLWGPDTSHTGLDPVYQERLVEAILQAVKSAAENAVPVSLKAGSIRTASVSPYFTSPEFGGKGPVGRTTGLIRDTRDPVTTDDTLTAVGLIDEEGSTVASIVHVHTHVEVSGGGHALSSDFAHAARLVMEARFGGTGIVWIGAEGGLQTPLGVPLPATDEDGRILWAECDEAAITNAEPECKDAEPGDPRVDAGGDPVPTWTEDEDWARTDSYGRLLGGLAADQLDQAVEVEAPQLVLRSTPLMLPIQNRYLQVFGRVEDTSVLDPLVELIKVAYPEYLEYIQEIYDSFEAAILDYPEEYLVTGEDCPLEAAGQVTGCVPSRMWSLKLGPVHILTAPGELLPELWRGTPAGAEAEYQDASLRGPDSMYFGYTDPDCAGVPYEDCRITVQIGECDCLNAHAAPYLLSGEPVAPPLISYIEEEFPILLGLTGEMTGYIIPEPDNTLLLTRPLEEMFSVPGVLDTLGFAENAKEHYEEAVSLGPAVATKLQQAAAIIFAD